MARFRVGLMALFAVGVLLTVRGAAPAGAAGADFQAQVTSDDDTRAQQLFIRGLTRAELDEPAAAIALFERALRYAPDAPAILAALADAHAATDDLEAALSYAERAHRLDPDRRAYHARLADLQQNAEQLDEARGTYAALLDQHPSATDVRLEYARLLAELDRPADALEEYETLAATMGPSTRLYIEMLPLYRELEDDDGLRETLETLVDEHPDESIFRMLLSQQYDRAGDTQAAIDLYERVLQLQPGDLNAAFRLAELYREHGDAAQADSVIETTLSADQVSADELTDRARSQHEGNTDPDAPAAVPAATLLERALELNPDHAEAAGLLGSIHFEDGAYAEAAPLLEQGLDATPNSAERWFEAAAAHLQADRPDRAAELADEALDQFPRELSLVRVAAYAHTEAEAHDTAIARFDEALDLLDAAPSGPEVRAERARYKASLGLLHDRTGDTEASDAHYERALRALELDPDLDTALNNYAYSLAERGEELDRALDMAKQAVEHDSENAAYLDTLGWVHYQRGNLDEAERWVRRSLDTGDASPTVYEHFGDIQAALDRPDRAQRYWQKALDRDPDRSHLEEKVDAPDDATAPSSQ